MVTTNDGLVIRRCQRCYKRVDIYEQDTKLCKICLDIIKNPPKISLNERCNFCGLPESMTSKTLDKCKKCKKKFCHTISSSMCGESCHEVHSVQECFFKVEPDTNSLYWKEYPVLQDGNV